MGLGWAGLLALQWLQALKYNMSRKTNSLDRAAASNAATGSSVNKRMKERNDFTVAAATHPSDEVMNALFEQVAVS